MALIRVSDQDGVRRVIERTTAEVVVCVPVHNAYDDVVQCLSALVRHTSPHVPLLLIDDFSSDPRIGRLDFIDERDVVIWPQQQNRGFVETVNKAFAATGPKDVVIVNSDVIVGANWLDRLRDAAYSSSNVATATPLTNNGTILSVGHGRNVPAGRLASGRLASEAATAVARVSPQLRPLIPTAVGHCTYFRRDALVSVGLLDPAFSPGYGEEVDFSLRALELGFVHVCADDVFVFHHGGSSFGRSDAVKRLIAQHEDLVRRRYPYYLHWVRDIATSNGSALEASLLVADAALRGLRVVIDGSTLGPTMMGTQSVVLQSARCLARHPSISELTVVVPPTAPAEVIEALQGAGARTIVSSGDHLTWSLKTDADIAFRPCQITRMAELDRLGSVAHRVVIWHLDAIAYNNPAYFDAWSRWALYRKATEYAFDRAQAIAFLSRCAESSARASGLQPTGASSVVYPGADEPAPVLVPRAPIGMDEPTKDFFLCLGVSYKHKNRLLALRIWAEAVSQGWPGALVLAGPTPPNGSSLPDEDEFLLRHPALRDRLIRLGEVSNSEKEWLYARTSVILYPTLAEGFGLIPFEAAKHGVPCLSTRAGSLDEILPADIPVIDPADIAASARTAVRLAQDIAFRRQVCDSLEARSKDFTWDATADGLVALFWRALARPGHNRTSLETGPAAGRRLVERLFGRTYPTIAWCIRTVVERPRLRAVLAPPMSRRHRAGASVVRYIDRRTR